MNSYAAQANQMVTDSPGLDPEAPYDATAGAAIFGATFGAAHDMSAIVQDGSGPRWMVNAATQATYINVASSVLGLTTIGAGVVAGSLGSGALEGAVEGEILASDTGAVAARPAFSGDWSNFRTLGISDSPLSSSQGQQMVMYLQNQGMDRAVAVDYASQLMSTGPTLPVANPVEVGDVFYKLVPSGGSVGPNSAYWMTESQLASLNGLTADQVGAKMGLPLAQQNGGFDLYAVKANTPSMSFTSTVAPTEEFGAGGTLWTQSGGNGQTLLLNRSLFSNPVLVQSSRF
jgi:hypothetical protein